MGRASERADPRDMTSMAGDPGTEAEIPHSPRLARLILVPVPRSARERLEAALGPELTKFLVSALCADGQGRVGSSSP